MLNRITIQGRLVRNPELRRTADDTPVASFTLACERDFKGKDGDRRTDFIDIVAWRNTAQFVIDYFQKGRMAIVEGRLQIRAWEDQEGNKRRAPEVVAERVYFGDSPKKDEAQTAKKEDPLSALDRNLAAYKEAVNDNEPLPF